MVFILFKEEQLKFTTMIALPSNNSEIVEEIISEITPPHGWITVDELQHVKPVSEQQEFEQFKKSVNLTLPYVAGNVEELIHELLYNIDMIISDTYLTIDSDKAYHALLLVSREDFLSPKIQAARILANRYLTSTASIGMRYTFSVDEEHYRAHVADNTYKLKYVPNTSGNGHNALIDKQILY